MNVTRGPLLGGSGESTGVAPSPSSAHADVWQRYLMGLSVVGILTLTAGCSSRPQASDSSSTTTRAGQAVSTSSSALSRSTNMSSTTTSVPSVAVAPFVGIWGGHGRSLTVSSNGQSTVQWRTYRNCTIYPAPRDKPGGSFSYWSIGFELTSESAGTATGNETSSDAPGAMSGPIMLTLDSVDLLDLGATGSWTDLGAPNICGPHATYLACGV
jgi:hypothetical protein